MQNRRVMPELFFKAGEYGDEKIKASEYPKNLFAPDKDIEAAKVKRKKFDEGKTKAQGAYRQVLKEGAMKRSYTIDEMTAATMLKGHPQAQEILDMLNKGKKKNESGEPFQDGSEDTVGAEGHAAVARPDSIKHEGKPSGIGPNEPGTGTKKASVEDGDLEKSDNLADNLPEEFEEGMVGAEGEDDDGDVLVDKKAKKSLTADEETLNHLIKSWGYDTIEKAVIGGSKVDYTKPYKEATAGLRASSAKRLAGSSVPADKAVQDVVKKKEAADKSEEVDLEKSEDENMDDKSYSLDFSKSILERMGLEKGATSVSKEASGGKATQINYGSKPTTRFSHPKAKSDKKFIHSPAKGTVKVEKEGEKTKEIGVSEESKLKNASVSSDDLYKSLDAILDKKRD